MTAYRAGHVLGAAMFMVEIAGLRVLYTGDYSRLADRHLSAADLPELKPDVGTRNSVWHCRCIALSWPALMVRVRGGVKSEIR